MTKSFSINASHCEMPIGTGMAALACLLVDLGYDVVGSDTIQEYFTDKALKAKNIEVFAFGKITLTNDFIYIISHAYDSTNCEVKFIKQNKFTYYYYSDFLGKVLNYEIIAISGTHGKTTTTKFLACLLNDDVSYIIGDGSGKGCNSSNLLLLEACEYKNHFLKYQPKILVINNIDLDHVDFFNSIDDVINSFQALVNLSDLVIVNGDDENIAKLNIKTKLTVGKNEQNDVVFKIIKETTTSTTLTIKMGKTIHLITIPFLGEHLIYDFLMAYTTCAILGKSAFIKNLKLPRRRMEEIKYGKSILIDDYAHHPKEIDALFSSLNLKYQGYIKNVIFQPHTYTRTLKLKKQFKNVLEKFDSVYMCDVFTSKREEKNRFLQIKINKIYKKYPKFTKEVLKKISKEKEEIWLFLGAGIVDEYIQEIIKNENN